MTGSKAEPVAEMVLPSGWGQGIEQPITPPPERTLVFGAVRGTEISAQPGKLAGRRTLTSRHCPVKTHIMELQGRPSAEERKARKTAEVTGRPEKENPVLGEQIAQVGTEGCAARGGPLLSTFNPSCCPGRPARQTAALPPNPQLGK